MNVGDQYNIPNADPWTKATEFDKEFIVPLYNSIVGNITVPVQVIDKKNDAGEVTESHIEWVDRTDPDIVPICNKKGGNYLYRQLRLIFSRPAALGDLSNDEIVFICSDNCDAIFMNLVINDIEYGVDIDKLLLEEPTFLNTMHMYMTSIKDGGLLKFGSDTVGINWKPDQNNQNKEDYEKIVNKGNNQGRG